MPANIRLRHEVDLHFDLMLGVRGDGTRGFDTGQAFR